MSHLALSWSRWSDYDQCPRKFFLKYLDKAPNFKDDPTKKSIHLVRGENMHKQLEDYVLWRINQIHGTEEEKAKVRPAMQPECESVVPLLDNVIAQATLYLPETQLCVNQKWEKTEWFDTKTAHYRAILDFVATFEQTKPTHALIWDYKSGKHVPYAEECGQLHLSAAMVITLKGYDYVDCSYLFLDSRKAESIRLTQEDAPKIIKIFDERSERVNSEVTWAPKRNEHCKWCNATKAQCPNSSKQREL